MCVPRQRFCGRLDISRSRAVNFLGTGPVSKSWPRSSHPTLTIGGEAPRYSYALRSGYQAITRDRLRSREQGQVDGVGDLLVAGDAGVETVAAVVGPKQLG